MSAPLLNEIEDLRAMITAAVDRHPVGRERTAELKACQWRLRSASGLYVQSCASVFDLMNPPKLGPVATAAVFDGRDNEDAKHRYFQATMKVLLGVEIVPQVTGRREAI